MEILFILDKWSFLTMLTISEFVENDIDFTVSQFTIDHSHTMWFSLAELRVVYITQMAKAGFEKYIYTVEVLLPQVYALFKQ